jgi:hypothetical protein
MERIGSFSQKTRITRKMGAETANNKIDNTAIRQKMIADEVHYHDEKLGFGSQGAHEGWIKAEEAGSAVSAENRQKMIEVAAYYLAEKHGFAGHGADEYWMKAEAVIDEKLHSHAAP